MVGSRGWALAAAVGLGCSDYAVGTKPRPEQPTDETATPTTPTTPTTTTPEPTPTAETGHTGTPGCASVDLPELSWVATAPFAGPADPIDGAGLPFWDPAADRSSWVPVAIPDRGIPVGFDRAYHATFTLSEVPVDLSLNLQSDDGIWVWLNGTPVGHWGGPWQQEGCVNDRAACVVTTAVPAVDVTPLLVVGTNTLAARVSNPVRNGYFEILPECVDR